MEHTLFPELRYYNHELKGEAITIYACSSVEESLGSMQLDLT